MVEASTIISIVITVVILGIVGFIAYRRISQSRAYPRRYPGRPNSTTPEGEPLEDPRSSYSTQGNPTLRRNITRIVIPAVIGIIVVSIVLVSSIKIVEAGNRGVLTRFGAVDTSVALEEGLHFVTPFRDNVIPIEVRTQKSVENAASASKDLQDVSTQVALNYHINPNSAQIVYQQLGFDHANRVINPAIQESVKQVTARFNAEELITKRESVKNEIEQQIKERLAIYNIVVETISITEFKFSDQFTRAVEAKVEAEQRALQAQNELRRIEIEAQQAEAKAIGDQKANIARAEGLRQANILEAEGEAEAIRIIDQQLRENPNYLEWLKTQRWDGRLPLVVGEGGTPFIQIPTTVPEGEQEPN
ncbi:MAG: prohibitin family protein [Nitrososphaera sp.]|nr:prohibitin family protein [Nitrososphaera sp.]